MTSSREFKSWQSMRQRCENVNDDHFKNYGARGISVCKRWSSFENFYADMGPRPMGMTLDREDVDGNYEPDNCRWATHVTQHNNTRRNRFIEHSGQRMTATEWSRVLGVPAHLILRRINSGWDPSDALTKPVDTSKQPIRGKMSKSRMYRQGDVLVVEVDAIDKAAEPAAEDHEAFPIAYGETTHHRHQVAGAAGGNKLFRRGAVQWLEVTAKGGSVLEVTSDRGEKLTPERHEPIALPKGKFAIVVQDEYTPEAYRPVGD